MLLKFNQIITINSLKHSSLSKVLISTMLILIFTSMSTQARNKEPWIFVSCSGYVQKTYDTKENVAIYSNVFYSSEMKSLSRNTIIASFATYIRANYPKFSRNECYYHGGYETERKAKDGMNDSVASTRELDFKVYRTWFEY